MRPFSTVSAATTVAKAAPTRTRRNSAARMRRARIGKLRLPGDGDDINGGFDRAVVKLSGKAPNTIVLKTCRTAEPSHCRTAPSSPPLRRSTLRRARAQTSSTCAARSPIRTIGRRRSGLSDGLLGVLGVRQKRRPGGRPRYVGRRGNLRDSRRDGRPSTGPREPHDEDSVELRAHQKAATAT